MEMRTGFIFAGCLLAYFFGLFSHSRPESYPVQGKIRSGFERVEAAFKKNFGSGLEKEGSALAVFYQGELVVDLWGGYADAAQDWLWHRDTITVAFSATKAVCAVAMGMLVDRGLLDYDRLVTDYWPAFGAHGKDNITVGMLLSHRGGLAYFDEAVTEEMVGAKDWEGLGRIVESQRPAWPPGTRMGYHALTYGFLGIDFHLGLPAGEFYRVAKQEPPSALETLGKLANFAALKIQLGLMFAGSDSIMNKAFTNPAWFVTSKGRLRTNHPGVLGMELGSANGVGTARGLAHIFHLLQARQLIKSESVMGRLEAPLYLQSHDAVLGIYSDNGYGFGYARTPLGEWEFGHPGYGGQNVKVNLGRGLSYAYLTNGLTPDMGDTATCFANLRTALYEDLHGLQ